MGGVFPTHTRGLPWEGDLCIAVCYRVTAMQFHIKEMMDVNNAEFVYRWIEVYKGQGQAYILLNRFKFLLCSIVLSRTQCNTLGE